MAKKNDLSIIAYAPALTGEDDRPVMVVRSMERALPGLRLGWTVSDDHQLVALPQRDVWLAQNISDGGFQLICNNDESYPVTIFGLGESARFSPGRKAQFEVHAELPLDVGSIAAAASVLEGIAEGARAFWGHATPFEAGVEISRQTRDPVRKPGVPPRGLPALNLAEDIRSPEIPRRRRWRPRLVQPPAHPFASPSSDSQRKALERFEDEVIDRLFVNHCCPQAPTTVLGGNLDGLVR